MSRPYLRQLPRMSKAATNALPDVGGSIVVSHFDKRAFSSARLDDSSRNTRRNRHSAETPVDGAEVTRIDGSDQPPEPPLIEARLSMGLPASFSSIGIAISHSQPVNFGWISPR